MKDFLKQIPKKWKGYYFIWVSINFFLLMLAGFNFEFVSFFYPFFKLRSFFLAYKKSAWYEPGLDFTSYKIYDLSEFFAYTIIPIFIALAIYYLKPTKDKDVK